jgi:hypothetical protein
MSTAEALEQVVSALRMLVAPECENETIRADRRWHGQKAIEALDDARAVRAADKATATERRVTIPARADHHGLDSITVTLPWTCIHCGGPRGEPYDALSYDGSLRLHVHSWTNPCGHIEKYSEIRAWLANLQDGRASIPEADVPY